MCDRHFVFLFFSIQICLGIYIPSQEEQRPAYTAGIKTTFKKPTNPYALQNYSKVVVHNRPDSPGAQYVVTQTQEVRNIYPVYNAHTYGQRPQNYQNILHEQRPQNYQNILQTQSNTEINAGLIGFSTTKPNRTIIKRKIESKTLEIYDKCPSGTTGQFIYSLSCNQFLNCWKGRGTVQNCAPGTLFNPKTLECDFPDKVECVSGPRSNTLENLRVEKSIKQATCPEGFSGIIPDYFDCSKFINCNNGEPIKMDCAPGTLFDMDKNMCDYPQQTRCFNGQNFIDIRTQPNENIYYRQGHACNPSTQDCRQGTTYQGTKIGQGTAYGQGTIYESGANYGQSTNYGNACNPYTHDCGQGTTYGQGTKIGQGTTYGQSTTQGQSGQGTIYEQGTKYVQTTNYGNACNPSTHDCGQGTTYGQGTKIGQGSTYGQTTTQGQSATHEQGTIYEPGTTYVQTTNYGNACNPSTHDCGQGIKIGQGTTYRQSTIQGQSATHGQGTIYEPGTTYVQTTNYGNACNPSTHDCGQGTTYGQGTKIGQGSTYGQSTTQGQSATHGQGTIYESGATYGQSTNYGNTCNPSTHNCGQGTQIGQGTTYGQSTTQGQTVTHGQGTIYEPGKTYVQSTNYGNACNPSTHDCRQGTTHQGTNIGQGTTYEQSITQGQSATHGQGTIYEPGTTYVQSTNYGNTCNPSTHNCGQGTKIGQGTTYEQSTTQGQGTNIRQKTNNEQGVTYGQTVNHRQSTCNPAIQNCGQTTDESDYGQTIEQGNTGQQTDNSYDTFRTNHCDPSANRNCKGQQNEYLGNAHGELGRHNCNPAIHDCKKYVQNQSGYGQVGQSSTSLQENSNGGFGQTVDTTNTLGNGDSSQFIGSCNPFLQNCNSGRNRPKYTCNLSTQHCGYDTQTGNGEQSQLQPNYGKVCNVNDPNCGQITKTTENKQVNVLPACPDGAVGMHKHPTDCKKYLTCGSGETFVMDCASGTLFNTKTGMCDFPYNVKCEVTNDNNNYEQNNGNNHIKITTNNWDQQPTNNNRGQQDNNYWDSTSNNGQYTVTENNRGQSGNIKRPTQHSNDYDDIYDPNNNRVSATTARSAWPPPYQVKENDINSVEYTFTYDDGTPVTIEPENIVLAEEKRSKNCDDNDFHCTPKLCISLTMVCDDKTDCDDGKDELNCQEYTQRFSVTKNSQLVVVENQRWINITYSTCALLCIQNTKFTCRSFTYATQERICYLSDKNIGLSGSLQSHKSTDYYELKDGTINCSDNTKYFECPNKKCLTKEYLCDGYDDCGDREDEKHCKSDKFGYKIKLAGSKEKHEGRIEVTAFGSTGYICDDEFGITDANVICRELGFELGAAEIKGQSQFATDLKESNTLYMIDDLNCRGNESTLIDCSFPGWGIHNCRDQEIAGVICKTPQEKCGNDTWKCDSGKECIPYDFVCDGVEDCADSSDEGVQHCEAPTELRLSGGSRPGEGRIEIKHNGIWGTICDDDFNEDAGKVVCNFLGYKGSIIVKKEGFFGAGFGPIWLDQVSCYGNETELHQCTHWNWGEHNCEHSEDVGIICSNDNQEVKIERHSNLPTRIEDGLPTNCGFRKDNQFAVNDLIHARVIGGGIAKNGDYPWQAALKVRVKDKSAHWCGAIIISSKWVLTAAHCLQGYTKGAYIIVAGDYNVDRDEGTEQQKYIEEFFVHENFRKGHKLNNDIALIKVKGGGFELNDDIQPICLADADTNYNKELNCTISGFGSVKSGASAYSHNLLAAWIPIHSKDICKMPHVYGDILTDNMICAGSMDGGLDACDGDSGGPLACLDQGVYTLYGITSWGQHCGYANKPGVYVKVGNYKEWIEDTISKHSQ